MTAPDLEYVDPAETARYNVAQDASDTLDAYAERITNDLAEGRYSQLADDLDQLAAHCRVGAAQVRAIA